MTFTLNWSITLHLGKSTVTDNQQHIPISTPKKNIYVPIKIYIYIYITLKLYKQKCKEIGQHNFF